MTRRARAKRDALALANLGLVASIARTIHRQLPEWFDLGDLIAVGNIALVKKAEAYDPKAHGGAPFSAFARQGIRGAILDSVRRNKFVENCRASIDACGPSSPLNIETSSRAAGEWRPFTHFTEASRALERMAHQPTAPAAIDRARLNRRVSEAISWLRGDQRVILSLWYADVEMQPFEVAKMMGLSLAQATELHDRAIASLRARLSGGALPRAA